ncbi:hypothetical protein [Brevundimonas sp. SGAir0440]|uniref:hypothetical protein n=1 Tax=Brevundimonas sp. SGAir0440 TaxID=2579977 RepID=UPI0010CD64FD|nr:hypothetical protein [Brevundimonas sp. SGAir0440]QCQ98504.1 hypothetical protein E7T10_07405 [Brevundimonas sp. SGAir0440]
MTDESKPKVGPTDARRRASAAYHKKRTDAGMKKVTIWLSPEAQVVLDILKDEYGSKDAVVESLLNAHAKQG